jgi:hypothetical protein
MTDAALDIEDVGDSFAACLETARMLDPGDDAMVTALLAKAAALGVSDVQADMLIKAMAKATGVGLKALRRAWAKAIADLVNARRAADAPKQAQREAEARLEAALKREAERARLSASCSTLANSPTLLAEIEKVAHRLGLVNEGAAARAVYLVYVSRLLADGAVRLLRSGASASGKNIVVELTLPLIPEDAVVQISASSPKSLAYFGGVDQPDALKHKIVYIPEAVILAEKKREEADGGGGNEFTAMFRTLISEGRVVYQTVTVQDGGAPETITIIKNGPIAAILTSARDIDPEMKTRVMMMETDETGEQTEAIVEHALSDEADRAGKESGLDLKPWLDLQLWLEMDAPYRVRVPFRRAIFLAFRRWRPNFFKIVAMRMRRDVNAFLAAVKASAVLYRAQRETEDGAIIATLDDYENAYSAFDDGLAAAHGKASEKVIAVVKAIEDMQGSDPFAVRVTLRDLSKRLRVGSISTAKARLDAALEYGAIDQDEVKTARGGARYFSVVEKSEEIRKMACSRRPTSCESVFLAQYLRKQPNSSNKRLRDPGRGCGYERHGEVFEVFGCFRRYLLRKTDSREPT